MVFMKLGQITTFIKTHIVVWMTKMKSVSVIAEREF